MLSESLLSVNQECDHFPNLPLLDFSLTPHYRRPAGMRLGSDKFPGPPGFLIPKERAKGPQRSPWNGLSRIRNYGQVEWLWSSEVIPHRVPTVHVRAPLVANPGCPAVVPDIHTRLYHTLFCPALSRVAEPLLPPSACAQPA